jgi:hypothetical protein
MYSLQAQVSFADVAQRSSATAAAESSPQQSVHLQTPAALQPHELHTEGLTRILHRELLPCCKEDQSIAEGCIC